MPKTAYKLPSIRDNDAPNLEDGAEAPPVPATPVRKPGRRGRAFAADPKYNKVGFRSFNFYLDEHLMARSRFLLTEKKIRQTLPPGINDMSDLMGYTLAKWYESEKDTP